MSKTLTLIKESEARWVDSAVAGAARCIAAVKGKSVPDGLCACSRWRDLHVHVRWWSHRLAEELLHDEGPSLYWRRGGLVRMRGKECASGEESRSPLSELGRLPPFHSFAAVLGIPDPQVMFEYLSVLIVTLRMTTDTNHFAIVHCHNCFI